MYPEILQILEKTDAKRITDSRKKELEFLVDSINDKIAKNDPINLVFICTHNSRRSQLAQVWATVTAHFNQVEINTYSGGTEVTEFNINAINSLIRFGFNISKQGDSNPEFDVKYSDVMPALKMYSKHYSDCGTDDFIAILTCSHADDNCPYIPNASKRVAVKYNDPKHFDNSTLQDSMYDATNFTIAEEMQWVFSQVVKP